MKLSELTRDVAAEFCRIIMEDQTDVELAVLDAMINAAKQFCANYTGLTEAELDEHEDITVAALVLISDMYDNRQMYVDKAHVNRTSESILGMHSVNLIPEEIVREETTEGE